MIAEALLAMAMAQGSCHYAPGRPCEFTTQVTRPASITLQANPAPAHRRVVVRWSTTCGTAPLLVVVHTGTFATHTPTAISLPHRGRLSCSVHVEASSRHGSGTVSVRSSR